MQGEHEVVLYPLLVCLENGGGYSRRGGFKPHSQKDHGTAAVLFRQRDSVHGGINNTNIRPPRPCVLKASSAPGDTDHISKRRQNHSRNVGQRDGMIQPRG